MPKNFPKKKICQKNKDKFLIPKNVAPRYELMMQDKKNLSKLK